MALGGFESARNDQITRISFEFDLPIGSQSQNSRRMARPIRGLVFAMVYETLASLRHLAHGQVARRCDLSPSSRHRDRSRCPSRSQFLHLSQRHLGRFAPSARRSNHWSERPNLSWSRYRRPCPNWRFGLDQRQFRGFSRCSRQLIDSAS